jgi:ATP-dependent DNA helicase RecQ
VPVQAKYAEVLRLLRDALKEEGGAIIFCARQKTVECRRAFKGTQWCALKFTQGL